MATRDEGKPHAFDEQTGKEIWTYEMSAAFEVVPSDSRLRLVPCANSSSHSASRHGIMSFGKDINRGA